VLAAIGAIAVKVAPAGGMRPCVAVMDRGPRCAGFGREAAKSGVVCRRFPS